MESKSGRLLEEVFLRTDGYDLAGAIGLHADAVNRLRRLYGSAIVGDDDELRFQAQFAHDVAEAIDVRLI